MELNENKQSLFLAIANVLSSESNCQRRKVGCVLLDKNKKIIGSGYNGPPKDFPHCSGNTCEGIKAGIGQDLDKCQAIHAEQNALMQCHDVNQIKYVVCTTFPCEHCLKMICNTGAEYIYFHDNYPNKLKHMFDGTIIQIGGKNDNIYK